MKYPRTVACIMWFGDKVMLAQRKNTDTFSGYWEVAGGKVEPDETIEDGIKREIVEEMKIVPISKWLTIKDCITDDPTTDKCFIFAMWLPDFMFKSVHNPEPDKRTPWKLFTREEAKKLKLMPGLLEHL